MFYSYDTVHPEIYKYLHNLSLHAALPISSASKSLCRALYGGEDEHLAPLLLVDQVEINQPDQVCPRRRIGHPVCSLVSGDLVHAARMTNGVQKQGALAVVQGCTQS